MINLNQIQDDTQSQVSIQFPLLQHESFMKHSVLLPQLKRDRAGHKVVNLITSDMNIVSYSLSMDISNMVNTNYISTVGDLVHYAKMLNCDIICHHTFYTSGNMNNEYILRLQRIPNLPKLDECDILDVLFDINEDDAIPLHYRK